MSEIPQDAIVKLRDNHMLHFAPAAGTHWFRFNTQKDPFTNKKMRQALALAINRKEIVEHITKGGQKSAIGIVPPILGLNGSDLYQDNDLNEAWALFEDALVEMKLDKESLPPIALCYKAGDRSHKIAQAVQQQWKKAFNIDVKLESCENKHYFERIASQDFSISSGSWYADYLDPINFLEIFKYKNNAANNTHWENEDYIELLNSSSKEADRNKRFALLDSAEQLLMGEMPIAPLFFGEFNYAKRHALTEVYISPLGYLDFKHAHFNEFEVVE